MLTFEELTQDDGFVKWVIEKPGLDKTKWDDLYKSIEGEELIVFNEAIKSIELLNTLEINSGIDKISGDKIEANLKRLHLEADEIGKNKILSLIGVKTIKFAASILIFASICLASYSYFKKPVKIFDNYLAKNEDYKNNIIIENEFGDKYVVPKDTKHWVTNNGIAISVDNNTLSFSKSDNFTSVGKKVFKIYTPTIKHYNVDLIDGTSVKLNANSVFEFDLNSESNKRIAKLGGEAYFKVAHNKERPFLVEAQDITVEVLGTEFNITAYPFEKIIATTLFDGSVRVEHNNGDAKVIEPGTMAVVYNDNENISVEIPDLKKIKSWITGKFIFSDNRLEDIMVQLSRWYGVKVSYETEELKNLKFTGELIKENGFENLLKKLEYTEGINYVITDTNILLKN